MTDYQKLEAIYNEIDTLIANNVMAESPEFESVSYTHLHFR